MVPNIRYLLKTYDDVLPSTTCPTYSQMKAPAGMTSSVNKPHRCA